MGFDFQLNFSSAFQLYMLMIEGHKDKYLDSCLSYMACWHVSILCLWLLWLKKSDVQDLFTRRKLNIQEMGLCNYSFTLRASQLLPVVGRKD